MIIISIILFLPNVSAAPSHQSNTTSGAAQRGAAQSGAAQSGAAQSGPYTIICNVAGACNNVVGGATSGSATSGSVTTARSAPPLIPTKVSPPTASNMSTAPKAPPIVQTANAYSFIKKWGSHGIANGQFINPSSVALDSSGNVYVTDLGNNRVQKFNSYGAFIAAWGSQGTANGQFNYPAGVSIDSSGNVYVTDSGNGRIQKFNSNGTFITKWGSNGTTNGQFNNPRGIAVDSSGNVYVADTNNWRIQKFDNNGTFITAWDTTPVHQPSEFPNSVAVDSSGNVYVSSGSIKKFDNNGTFITKWGSEGSANGQFTVLDAVAVDSSGNVYTIDFSPATSNYDVDARIQKFTADGTFITKWGSAGSANGQFYNPTGIAVDPSGNVYVADNYNHRIQVFSPLNNPRTHHHHEQ